QSQNATEENVTEFEHRMDRCNVESGVAVASRSAPVASTAMQKSSPRDSAVSKDIRMNAVSIPASFQKSSTSQCLTKRASRRRDLINSKLSAFAKLPSVWWGVSVEDKNNGIHRIHELRRAPVRMRFLSVERLLEDLGNLDLTGIH